ncbi:DUF1289 domain-containing protein [Marinimicrobium sp. ARAG 43.8]|uniref:DUF1289 domain-containing protein n=1 Tax=Marinimicrobium sp. ARAG 43.8 TaxID=3418719 RepID=UPI003CF5C5D4
MTVFKRVKTPCVGVCSTGIGDSVCRGCKRFAHEVIDWNAYDQSQRQIIVHRLEGFLSQVVALRFNIVDKQALLTQIQHQQIRFNQDQDPYCWVFDLLKAGASQIRDLAHYGLRLHVEWQGVPLTELRDQIDRDFYELSCAHYERYIEPGLARDAALKASQSR